jgi:uncharacterized protein (TIGR03435 family)
VKNNVLLIVAVVTVIVVGLLELPRVLAQTATTDWGKAASGKMAFEVASVKQNKSGEWQIASNVPLDDANSYPATGGLFSATNIPLSVFIGFAYKLAPAQDVLLRSQLPKWAVEDRFDIEARAQADSTKDQMRLMMQSLLADRFKLAVHFENRQTPVYELVVLNPNKLGPQLRQHSDNPPCPALGDSTAPDDSRGTIAGGFPNRCSGIMALQPDVQGHQRMAGRDVPWSQFASLVALMGRLENRPVVDHTGITGKIDLVIEWQPGAPSTTDAPPEQSGPTFLEAVQDQLGLKLNSKIDPVELLVIDHVEEPSPN